MNAWIVIGIVAAVVLAVAGLVLAGFYVFLVVVMNNYGSNK
jgi:hypothetical protein